MADKIPPYTGPMAGNMTSCPKRDDQGPCCHCMPSPIQHAVMNHLDVRCCFCGKDKCTTFEPPKPPPGHGPFAVRRG